MLFLYFESGRPGNQAAGQPGGWAARRPGSQAAGQPGSQAARPPGGRTAGRPGGTAAAAWAPDDGSLPSAMVLPGGHLPRGIDRGISLERERERERER